MPDCKIEENEDLMFDEDRSIATLLNGDISTVKSELVKIRPLIKISNIISERLVASILELVKKLDTSNKECEGVLSEALQLLYQINQFCCCPSRAKEIDDLILGTLSNKDSGLVKHELIRQIYSKISNNHQAFTEIDEELIECICKSSVSNSGGLRLFIDATINWCLKTSKTNFAWLCISEFVSSNKNEDIEDLLQSSIYTILNDIEAFLPYIYDSINNAQSQNSIGFLILEKYAFNHDDKDGKFYLTNWCNGLNEDNVLRIAERVFLVCRHARFLSKWSLSIIKSITADISEKYMKLTKELVCDNYPNTFLAEVIKLTGKDKIEDNNGYNSALYKELENYVKSNKENENSIIINKNFSQSRARMKAYQIEYAKTMARITEEGKKKSVFYDLFKKQSIKYGARSAHVQSQDGTTSIVESDYYEIAYSMELPRIFIADPFLLLARLDDTFNEVSQ